MKKKIMSIINILIKRGYWYNNILFNGSSFLSTYKTFDTDVINLGSLSAKYAFDYSCLSIKGANFAIPSNPLLGDYHILRNFSSYLKPEGSVVIITLCPFSSLAGSYDFLDDRYYTFLYPSSIPNFNYKHSLHVLDQFNNPLKYYPIMNIISDLKHALLGEKIKQLTEDEMQKDAEMMMKCWKQEFSLKDFNSQLSLKNKDAIIDSTTILNKIIEYCRYKHFNPVIVLPPMYHTLSDLLDSKARMLLFDTMLKGIEDTDVPVLNYMDNQDFKDISLFKSSFLLNKRGARAFTADVLKQIGLKFSVGSCNVP